VKTVPGGVELSLDLDSRIGIGKATGTADFGITTATPFTLQGFRYYQGARLVNANKDVEYRIVDALSGSSVVIDSQAHPEAKADKLAGEFPKDSWFEIYDYGVGDEVVWPYTVSVTRLGANIYQITSPVPVTINLPEGSKVR